MSDRTGGPPHPVVPRATPRAARSVLAALLTSVGSGLAVADREPWLSALVDQHAAAVRDGIRGVGDPRPGAPESVADLLADRRRLTAAELAGYAEGVRDAAVGHGWQPPTGTVDWSCPDWVLVRLLAVCALARDRRLLP